MHSQALNLSPVSIVIDSPVGHLWLAETAGALTGCAWTSQAVRDVPTTPLLQRAVQQLHEYFCGVRFAFDLPLNLSGTDFQCEVWRSLATIPYGTTYSYQELAHAVGRPRAYRAVGSANGKNPLAIIMPCHRVILASGELGGFSSGVEHKKRLLALERLHRVNVPDSVLSMTVAIHKND